MKIYNFLAIIVIVIVFSGCCEKQPPEKIFVTKEVKIPVKCEVPEVSCDFKGEGFTPVVKVLECLVNQKRAIEYCNGELTND